MKAMRGAQQADIVVGVDGSESSRAALVFALREGARRASAVAVVTVWTLDQPADRPVGPEWQELPRVKAEQAQDEAVTAALATVAAPPLLLRMVLEGAAGPVLLREAREADFLVVGHAASTHAHPSAARCAALGSVSRHCLLHASVPVLVLPAGATVPWPVLRDRATAVAAG